MPDSELQRREGTIIMKNPTEALKSPEYASVKLLELFYVFP